MSDREALERRVMEMARTMELHGNQSGADDLRTCLVLASSHSDAERLGAERERAAVVAFLESRMEDAAADHAFDREGVLDALRVAIFNGTHRTEAT